MKWIHLSLVQNLIQGGILIDAIFATMILVPLIIFRYWMLASSLAKILGAIMSCTGLLFHLALPILLHFVILVWNHFSKQPYSWYACLSKQHVVMVMCHLSHMCLRIL